ncbi:bile salt-activated lipase [Galleria mellonella]|uniref:Bile salt-activated lipase n=1 Tax=Galleria mellonella TaxID=7137 RepID=A0A6J1WFW1_GALME|nr:bile salt-activated lipase [Galleria mellonella]
MYVELQLRFLILLTTIQCIQCSDLLKGPLVNSNAGLIRGLQASDGDYSMFLGIPYAKVNESNPFGVSIPQERFEEIYEANNDSLMLCPQYKKSSNTTVGNINCLYLNVYVPNVASLQNRLPVMIWIHGGAFMTGSGRKLTYGPKFLVKQNIILVTINYRLGPYGFMCLDIPEVPGNQGMKDQLLALRWVKNNIEAFGGDVNKITAFGESAGAMSVDLHILSVHDIIFNKVIMQSGTALASTILVKPDKLAPIKIAKFLGFKTESVPEALNFLVTTDPNLIIAAVNSLDMLFKPCVETKFSNVEPFILKSWINANPKRVRGMPILLGFNNKERLYEYVTKPAEYFDNLHVIHDKLVQTFTFNESKLTKMENIIHHFYMGDRKISIKVRDEIGDFDSDYTYIHPIQKSIRHYIKNSPKNIFYYMFSYSGKRNFNKVTLNVTEGGAFHGDEIGYLFDASFLPEDNQEDLVIVEQMTTMWTNFAKYGDPTPATSEPLPVKWTPLTKNKWYYLNIDSELAMGSRPLNERMAFWDLFYETNKKEQKGYDRNSEI